MIGLAPGTKVFLACQPIDLRAGFDGLAAKVQQIIGADPFSGHVFIFRSKRGHYLKGLYWDGSGMCLFAKRLERGKFVWPPLVDGTVTTDAGAIGAADRGDGLASDDSTAGAAATHAVVTYQGFSFCSGPAVVAFDKDGACRWPRLICPPTLMRCGLLPWPARANWRQQPRNCRRQSSPSSCARWRSRS